MGHATAEAVVSAGLELVPWSFTGESEAVVVGNIGVSGIPVQLIGKKERQEAMQRVKDEYPGLVMIDFTLPGAVNGNLTTLVSARLPDHRHRCAVTALHHSSIPFKVWSSCHTEILQSSLNLMDEHLTVLVFIERLALLCRKCYILWAECSAFCHGHHWRRQRAADRGYKATWDLCCDCTSDG